MHDHRGVLEIDSLAEQVGGDEQIDTVGWRRLCRPAGARSESGEGLLSREASAGDLRAASVEPAAPRAIAQEAKECRCRIGELGEGDDLLASVTGDDIPDTPGSLAIARRINWHPAD